MVKTIRARYSNGVIEPLEKINIDEGKELLVTITETPSESEGNGLEKSAGAWKGTIDCEGLIARIYADRLVSTRKKARL